jgi:hypothetical protein
MLVGSSVSLLLAILTTCQPIRRRLAPLIPRPRLHPSRAWEGEGALQLQTGFREHKQLGPHRPQGRFLRCNR